MGWRRQCRATEGGSSNANHMAKTCNLNFGYRSPWLVCTQSLWRVHQLFPPCTVPAVRNILECQIDAQTFDIICSANCWDLLRLSGMTYRMNEGFWMSVLLFFSPLLTSLQMLYFRHSLASWPPAPSWMSYCLCHDIIVFSFPRPSRVLEWMWVCMCVSGWLLLRASQPARHLST